mgnify:CR=1 FL=1
MYYFGKSEENMDLSRVYLAVKHLKTLLCMQLAC